MRIETRIENERQRLAELSGLTVKDIEDIETHFYYVECGHYARYITDSAARAKKAFYEGNFLPLTAHLQAFLSHVGKGVKDPIFEAKYRAIREIRDKLTLEG